MRKVAAAWRICAYQLRRLIMSYKSILFLMLFVVYALVFATPVADFAVSYNQKVNILGLLPVLTSDYLAQMVLMMGIVIMFSDAPFIDHNQVYIMMRCKRSVWAAGQILYIMTATLMFIIAALVISILTLVPHVSIDGLWGKVWQTLAHQGGDLQITVSARMVNQYTIIEALGYSTFLTWLAGFFIGSLMFLLNFITNTKVGLVAGGLLCLMNMAIYNSLFSYSLYSLSPLSLANLSVVDRYGMTYGYPTLVYAGIAMIFVTIVITLMILNLAKRGHRCLEMNV